MTLSGDGDRPGVRDYSCRARLDDGSPRDALSRDDYDDGMPRQ